MLLPMPTAEPPPTRSVITLSPSAGAAVTRMKDHWEPKPTSAEIVRRGLILLDLYLTLDPNEELIIRNKTTGDCSGVRLVWDTL